MDTEDTVVVRVKKLARLLDRVLDQTRLDVAMRVEGAENISPIQGRILLFVVDRASKGEVHQKDIETHFDLRRSTVAIILRRMEANKLITRHTSDRDVRMKTIRITEKAKAIYPSAMVAMERAEQSILDGLTPHEVEIFNKTLLRMTNNLS